MNCNAPRKLLDASLEFACSLTPIMQGMLRRTDLLFVFADVNPQWESLLTDMEKSCAVLLKCARGPTAVPRWFAKGLAAAQVPRR